MLKFIHTADWHLGAPNLPQAYENALTDLIIFARENGINTILCVGDVFDKPRPAQRIKDYLLHNICTNKDIRFIFIPGNHDYETKELAYHSLAYLKTLENTRSLDNVFIIEPGETKVIDGLRVVSANNYEEIKQYTAGSEPTVLAWHGTPKGVDFHKGIESYSFTDLPEADNLYIAFGDIHKNLWPYPGALTQKTFSCEAGFYVVSYAGKFEHVFAQLELPKRVTINIGEEIKEKDIIKFIQRATNKEDFVKIKFNLTAEKYAALDKEALRKELTNVVVVNDQKESSNRRYAEIIQRAKTIDEEILAFINTINTLDKEKLFSICKKYFKD